MRKSAIPGTVGGFFRIYFRFFFYLKENGGILILVLKGYCL